MLRGADTAGTLNVYIGPRAKSRLIAECEIREERDGVPWTLRRLVTEWALGTLLPLSRADEQRLNARSNGDHFEAEPKHKKQKAKPAA